MMKDMNFFAPYQGQKKEEKNRNIYVYSIVVFLAIGILGSLTWNTVNIILLNSKIKEYNLELESSEIKEKALLWEELSREDTLLKKYDTGLTNIINGVKTRDIVNTEILDKLSSCIPSQVTFNSININNKEIEIQAVSTSRVAIGEVEHNLRVLDNIQDVYIGSISGNEIFTFNIKCSLKGVN